MVRYARCASCTHPTAVPFRYFGPRLITRPGTPRRAFPTALGALTDERFEEAFGGAGDDVAADKLADLLGGLRAGFDGGADAADIALHDRGDERSADADALDDLNVGGFG